MHATDTYYGRIAGDIVTGFDGREWELVCTIESDGTRNGTKYHALSKGAGKCIVGAWELANN